MVVVWFVAMIHTTLQRRIRSHWQKSSFHIHTNILWRHCPWKPPEVIFLRLTISKYMYKLGKRKFIYLNFYFDSLVSLGGRPFDRGGGGTRKLCRHRLFIFSMNVTEKFISRKTKAKVFIFIRNKIFNRQKKKMGLVGGVGQDFHALHYICNSNMTWFLSPIKPTDKSSVKITQYKHYWL